MCDVVPTVWYVCVECGVGGGACMVWCDMCMAHVLVWCMWYMVCMGSVGVGSVVCVVHGV
jgi:hypothetical protein